MIRAIWITLFTLFAAYTALVYMRCDERPPEPPPAAVQAGMKLWQQHNCQSCHQLYGLGGYMGPDLTNTASAKGPDYMHTFIRYGSGRMPDFKLSDSQVSGIIAFLSWVDQSGSSRVPDSAVHWTGTYQLAPRSSGTK